MLNCKTVHKLLMNSLQDELNSKDHNAIKEHGDRCVTCHALIFEFSASNKFIDELQMHVEITESQSSKKLDDLWSKLEPELERIDTNRVKQLTHSRNRWRTLTTAMAIAACAILAVGFAFLPNDQRGVENIINPQIVAVNSTASDLRQYLNRAQPILLTLANTNTYDGFVPIDKGYAEIMALQAEVLIVGHESELSVSQHRLLKDVQYLLTQYANLEDGDMQSGLEVLQYFLGDNTVIFRMNLAELRDEIPVI